MRSAVFSFGGVPAYLDLESDVLFRTAFQIVTWHGAPDANAEDKTSGGWWHFDSGIMDHSERTLALFQEVTAAGYEAGPVLQLSDETTEGVMDADLDAQPRLILELLISAFPDLCKELSHPEQIDGFESDEFQEVYKG